MSVCHRERLEGCLVWLVEELNQKMPLALPLQPRSGARVWPDRAAGKTQTPMLRAMLSAAMRQSIDRASFHQRMIHVEDLVEPGSQQVGLSAFVPFLRPHRSLPRSFATTVESRVRARYNLPEIAAQATILGKVKCYTRAKILN
ncbi:hypothetical protein NKH63_30415 [Mesorhizobium sp. M0960]|uniref:hypothetical protein n=1 Tax=Mesorhizobium sp. M0960 TaxID=2957035 RepID=UPI003337126B